MDSIYFLLSMRSTLNLTISCAPLNQGMYNYFLETSLYRMWKREREQKLEEHILEI